VKEWELLSNCKTKIHFSSLSRKLTATALSERTFSW